MCVCGRSLREAAMLEFERHVARTRSQCTPRATFAKNAFIRGVIGSNSAGGVSRPSGLPEERCLPMSREPALER
eukprot:363534-Prymnesium_polylepis.1